MADQSPPGAGEFTRLDLDSNPVLQTSAALPSDGPAAPAAAGHTYGGGYGAPHGDDDRRHLSYYVRVLHKRRWTALTAFVVVLGLTVLHSFSATPIYRASSQILIEVENPNVVSFEEVLRQSQRTNDYFQTQYRILESRLLARRTLETEQLWSHPQFAGTGTPASSLNPLVWVSRAIAGARGLFGAAPPPFSSEATETRRQSQAITRFLSGLQIVPVRTSRLVNLTYMSPDPVLAARAVNGLAKAYIEQSLEFRFTATRDASAFLSREMTGQREAVSKSEQALQNYREQTGSVSLEEKQNVIVQRLGEVNAALTRARTDRMVKETAYEQVRDLRDDRAALATIPAVLSNSFIQQLKTQQLELQRQEAQMAEKFGDKHPSMVELTSTIRQLEAKLDAEVAKIVEGIRNDYQSSQALERQLAVAAQQQNAEALSLNRLSIQYDSLQRDAASNRQIYEGLMQRSKETGIAGELRASNIRVVDPAEVPRAPARPNKTRNVLMGLLGGLMLGVGLAFFFEYFDSRIKSPDEIRTALGLPFLGIVPAIDAKPLVSGALLISGDVPAQFAEAFRTIRTNVLFATAESGSRSVVVTSTVPGEGKSLVSTNLSVSLAMAGQRVLLVDTDLRRPKAHEIFNVPQEPGLSNILVGTTKASEAVRPTTVANLWLLPAGHRPPNPAELLGSTRFKDFLASLGGHFDWIILDSPPVMAVTDAAIVAHLASGVVFVVGSEMTNRAAARLALDQLDAARAKHFGAILNRVDLHRNSYYYSAYYRREYAQYYQAASGS